MKLLWVIIGVVVLLVGASLALMPTIMGKSVEDTNKSVEDELGDDGDIEDIEGNSYWIKGTVLDSSKYSESLFGIFSDNVSGDDNVWVIMIGDVDKLEDCGEDDCGFFFSEEEIEKDTSGTFSLKVEERDTDCMEGDGVGGETTCFGVDGPTMWMSRSSSQNTMFFVIPGAILAVVGLVLGVLLGVMKKD